MASTLNAGGVSGRMRNAALTFCSDNLSLITLEDAVVGLLDKSEDFVHFSSAVQSVADRYQPVEELTDFKKLFDGDASKLKANSSSDPKKHPLVLQFKEAIWNVHHEGQPMPGEEQEDIVMTSTQSNIFNMKYPITRKHVTKLAEPV